MNEKRIATFGLAIAGIIAWLAFVGGMLFVIVHFVVKFW